MSEDEDRSETRRWSPEEEPGDDATQRIDTGDATQRIPADDSTRQIPANERARDRGEPPRKSGTQEFQAVTKTASRAEESRRVRPARSSERSGSDRREPASSGSYGGYSPGYNEVLREREEYLRDIYGGVDWLASFAGFILALLTSALFGSGAALFLLAPLGLQESLADGRLTSTSITGFAVVAGVLFFSFLFGGYVSGRMARYDGGRNGAMVLLWTVLVATVLLLLSGVLGGVISGTPIGDVVGETLSFGATVTELLGGLGVSGALVVGGVILAALLGGMLGGRLGSRYHREIDYTP